MYYFSIDSCMDLCFVFLMKIDLIAHWCFSCCWAYPFIHQSGILIIQGDQVSKLGISLHESMLATTGKSNLRQQQPAQSSPLLSQELRLRSQVFSFLRLSGQIWSFPDLPSCHIPTWPSVHSWDESIQNICWLLWNSGVNCTKLHGLMNITTGSLQFQWPQKENNCSLNHGPGTQRPSFVFNTQDPIYTTDREKKPKSNKQTKNQTTIFQNNKIGYTGNNILLHKHIYKMARNRERVYQQSRQDRKIVKVCANCAEVLTYFHFHFCENSSYYDTAKIMKEMWDRLKYRMHT